MIRIAPGSPAQPTLTSPAATPSPAQPTLTPPAATPSPARPTLTPPAASPAPSPAGANAAALPEVARVAKLDVFVPASLNIPYAGQARASFPQGLPLGIGSGLCYDRTTKTGDSIIYTLTDRGPNGDSPALLDASGKATPSKVFPAPDYTPKVVSIRLDRNRTRAEVQDVLPLRSNGTPISGRPRPPGSTGATGEVALTEQLTPLPYDADGLDPEGLTLDANGDFWVCDEYGPFLAKVDGFTGDITHTLGPGTGLPEELRWRIPNRGFEGLTIAPNGHLFAAVQSVLNVDGATGAKAPFIRLIEHDPKTNATRCLGYPLEPNDYKLSSDAKIGDMAAIDDRHFLVVEQGLAPDATMRQRVMLMDLSQATDLTGKRLTAGPNAHKALEYGTREELSSLTFATKRPLVDLRAQGWTSEKCEGITILDERSFAISNDNDFGIVGTLTGITALPSLYAVDANGTISLAGKAVDTRYETAANLDPKSHLFVIEMAEPFYPAENAVRKAG